VLLEKLFENLALSVEPFAMCRLADGWRLRLAGSDCVTLHYTLLGDGELTAGSGTLSPICGNSLAVIPPQLAHAVQFGAAANETELAGQGDPDAPLCELVAGVPDERELAVACGRIQARYAGGMGLFDHLKDPIILDFSDSPHVRHIFEKLIEECRASGPASAAMMAALMNQCLIEVLRRADEQSGGSLPWLSALDDPRLAKVIEAILDRPERSYTLESLASLAAMSRSTFARHFEQHFARTPMDYLRDVRLRRAAQLLQVGGSSVDGVASKVGYASRSHFSQAFSEQFGRTPTEFRKQYQ
jgi:AraC family transcriptional activator of mtrCDE